MAGVVDVGEGGAGQGALSDTCNQSGLKLGYTSGLTLFDDFLALEPQHTSAFRDAEWFSTSGISSAQVTYDLGAVTSVSRLALWNEKGAGIGTLDLFGSVDGSDFFSLALGLTPTDNPPSPSPFVPTSYGADVFDFGGYRWPPRRRVRGATSTAGGTLTPTTPGWARYPRRAGHRTVAPRRSGPPPR